MGRVFSPSRLRSLRAAKGFTQAQLAAKVGISHTQISYYEHGRHRPSLDSLLGIADVCGIALDDLFEWVEVSA